jgi:hypothetical protein
MEPRITPEPAEKLFWSLVEPMLVDPAITRSTMMGLPCMRVDDKFFAALGRDQRLLVKLPAARVAELVASGAGQHFAPNGRVFREWVAFAEPDEPAWHTYLTEARAFVAAAARA